MKMFKQVLIAASALCLAALSACGEDEAPPVKQPNIILITAGDLAFEDLSVYGGAIPTPNLERLARQGTLYTHAYAAAAQVGPARAALASGQYPQRFGYHFDTGSVRKTITARSGMPDEVIIVPERLQTFGYKTALFGSWHLGAAPTFYPMFRGFDSFWGTLGDSTAYIQPRREEATFVQTKNFRLPPSRSRFNTIFTGRQAESVNNTNRYLTDDMGDQIVAKIEQSIPLQTGGDETAQASEANPPLLLWASFHAPREPLTALKEDIDALGDFQGSAQRRVYAAMVVALDRNVGKILDALERQGVLEETLVIFTADRGCDATVNTCPCDKLRGGAPSFREGGLRVPLIMSLPGRYAGGQSVSETVISMDIAATIIAFADPNPRLIPELDGVSLEPTLADSSSKLGSRTLFFEQYPLVAVISDKRKLLFDGQSNTPELFDISKDPGENTDLARDESYTVSELETQLDVWRQANTYALWEGFDTKTISICKSEEQILQ